MKLAFIVQRYGREILGGAETLARQIAERLSRRHEIDVLTTTARDYITWRNEYPSGEEKLRGVRIRRFPVRSERHLEEFNRFSEWIYHNPHGREDELKWLEMQGPVVPELVEALRQEHHRYDLLVFFTYLYYPTVYGLQVAPEKSVLVPTAHDEPPLALDIYKEVFNLPSSLIFNTEAEEILVLERFGVYKKMRETIGIGMELLDMPDMSSFRRRHKLRGRYLLYAGRIDAGKGCEELIRYFRFYKEERADAVNIQLVLIGKSSMKLPQARDIRYLGFVSEEDKLAAMAGAVAVVIPSRLESLSIVALEAFSVATPVVVNAGSRVLVEHCRKANAGLYYADYEEFEQILDVLLGDKNLSRVMGRHGQSYIKDNFGWQKLLNQYELALRSSARAPRPVVGAAVEPRQKQKTPAPPPVERPGRPSRRAPGEPRTGRGVAGGAEQVEAIEDEVPLESAPSVASGLPPGSPAAAGRREAEGISVAEEGPAASEEASGSPVPEARQSPSERKEATEGQAIQAAPPPEDSVRGETEQALRTEATAGKEEPEGAGASARSASVVETTAEEAPESFGLPESRELPGEKEPVPGEAVGPSGLAAVDAAPPEKGSSEAEAVESAATDMSSLEAETPQAEPQEAEREEEASGEAPEEGRAEPTGSSQPSESLEEADHEREPT